MNIFFSIAALNCKHTFYTASTSVPIDKKNPNSRKRFTKLLCHTVDPEDKRRIIGDTFMKVRQLLLEYWLCLLNKIVIDFTDCKRLYI